MLEVFSLPGTLLSESGPGSICLVGDVGEGNFAAEECFEELDRSCW